MTVYYTDLPGGERRGERREPRHVVQPTRRGGSAAHAGGFPATIRLWISQHSSWRCPCHGYSRGATPRDLLDGLATLPPCILVVPCTNPEGVLAGTTALSPGEEIDAGLCPWGFPVLTSVSPIALHKLWGGTSGAPPCVPEDVLSGRLTRRYWPLGRSNGNPRPFPRGE